MTQPSQQVFDDNGKLLRLTGGLTWYQWAKMQFEFMNCEECKLGVKAHSPAIVLGNWFALCGRSNYE